MSLLGVVADQIGRQIGLLRRRRTVAVGAGPVKVNVGSGIQVAPGWIHVDGSVHALLAGGPGFVLRRLYRATSVYHAVVSEDEYVRRLSEHRFVHHELERGLPLADGSVDFVFCSHVVEHLFRRDARRLLAEMHRVLRPGGWVRICVPDLEHALALFAGGDKEACLSFFFVDQEAGYYRRHRYMYDFGLLRDALRSAGFQEVHRRAFREGAVPDLEALDNLPEQTLFVEARKG